ncbi:GGDEF domain-containing protein [Siculibacillus lacustris]|uniref:diguanylate cyclase n=1 Tax=Siculibacillus lacustris TaxID=1549641 RepID=A0A4Q9VSH8_9HYPH|nr:GGDEF domain-containing protein [Siculibacillus lacustris]TBW37998.1 GGDEF domain-containing protein [Siculibacillus lacustris]
MSLDYGTLLQSIGFSGASLAVAMFVVWLSAPIDRFLLTWTAGLILLVAFTMLYGSYVAVPHPTMLIVSLAVLVPAMALVWGAAVQFRDGRLPFGRISRAVVVGWVVSVGPMAAGWDGLALIFENTVAALFLIATARAYWKGRTMARVPIIGLTLLYGASGLAFALCAVVLAHDGRMVIGVAPRNWAEDLGMVVWIGAFTAIGAVSLSLNQWRRALHHRIDALTDALTGLLNRRALYELHDRRPLAPHTAVIAFDLDRFKTINDRFGHDIGDVVLCRFAETLRACLGSTATIARLGGEEFTAVLRETGAAAARAAAERVRATFAAQTIDIGSAVVQGTVSAGIAFTGDAPGVFQDQLRDADRALYVAKAKGRDRVVMPLAA